MVWRLFLGGPWHETVREVPGEEWRYRVPAPVTMADILEPRTPMSVTTYVRKRMAHRPEGRVRSVFVPEWWTDREARDALQDYLVRRWVAERPDTAD